MKDADKIELLKQLLLDDDLKHIDQMDQEINKIEGDIYDAEKLSTIVNPIIKERIEDFEQEIPEKLGPSITAALKNQIKESQNEVVDALYPIIGKLVSKYIKIEFQRISDRVDHQMQMAFSWEGWKIRIKSWISGTKSSDALLQAMNELELHEFFVIEKDSGLLLGNYSKSDLVDPDMIAGMLTAIKSFVEDAFNQSDQQLEGIEYDNYRINLYSVGSFYMAVVTSGILTAESKAKLEILVTEFVQIYLKNKANTEVSEPELLNDLKTHFEDAEI